MAPYIEQYTEHFARYEAARRESGRESLEAIESISLDDVSFEYAEGVPVLRSVSFSIRPGEAIGVVGPSGSGKSTLVQLLLRRRQPAAGAYLVNGRDASRYSSDSFARHFAYVPQ